MNVKKRVEGSWVDAPDYLCKYSTQTNTITKLPANIIANGTKASVGLKGNLEQQTYSGKNLVDISMENWKFYNNSTTIDVADNKITIDGSWFAYIIVPVAANTNYTLQYVCESYTKKNLAAIFGVENGVMNSSDSIVANAPSGKTFNTGERTEVALLFYASDSSETGTSIYSNIQLELGSTATSYEPYVGGIPSPNPDYPQEVVGVGERTANLFDYKKYFESTFTEYGEYFAWAEIKLKPFATYSFSTSYSQIESDGIHTAFIVGTSTETPTTVDGGISSTHTVTKTTEADGIIKIYIRISGRGLVPKKEDFDSGENWLMINLGSTPLPYEPYGYKIPMVTRGKNLFDISTLSNGTHLDATTGLPSVHNDRIGTNEPIDVSNLNNVTITYSFGTEIPEYFMYSLFKFDGTLIERVAGKRSGVAIDVSNADKMYLAFYIGGTTVTINDLQYVMLNTGTTPEPYEPYIEPLTTPIYLDSPLYKIGDYADVRGKMEEVRAAKELVLTGEEAWSFSTLDSKNRAFMTDWRSALGNSLPLCTHYVGISGGGSYPSEGKCLINSNGTPIFNADFVSDKTEWKSYLAAQYAAGTPVKVYYVLSTPETNPVDAAEIQTLSGTTVVDVTTSVKPSEISLDYTGWHPMVVHRRMNGVWT